jgi:hypothetical protein
LYLEVELQDMLTASKELWRKGDQPAVVPVQDLSTADLTTYQTSFLTVLKRKPSNVVEICLIFFAVKLL